MEKTIRILRYFAKVQKCRLCGNCNDCLFIDLCADMNMESMKEDVFSKAADYLEQYKRIMDEESSKESSFEEAEKKAEKARRRDGCEKCTVTDSYEV